MKQFLYTLLMPVVFFLTLLSGSALLSVQPVGAASPLSSSCKDPTLKSSDICKDQSDKLFGANSFWTRLINTLIYIIGALAVLMVVIGGLRYVISGGDAGQTKSAKDTILYAIIGVMIALMAYAIVNFVVVRLVQ